MALNSGKILMRRGQEANFDPNKMMPGEWAVSLDSKYVRMCFSPGVCIRMATYEAFEADMEQIREILAECQTVEEAVQRIYEDIKDVAVDVERIEAAAASALESEENALNSANSASQSANTATQKASEAAGSANIASTKAEQATEGASTATQKASEAAESADNVRNMSDVSQSYAVGSTGTREGEDTDNAKYYNQQASDNADRAEAAAERASAVADVGVATTEKAGLVKPDGETIRVDPDGTIHADRGTTSYTDLENKPRINDVELNGNKTVDELGGLTAESTVSFTEAEERTNIEATDNVKGIFGKIKKWFADLKPHAFSNPTNNLLATVAGTPLDAVQGKVLSDRCTAISQKLLVSTNVLGDRAVKADMLDVDFSSSTSDKNKAHRIGTEDATLLANSPVTSGQFYGKWECIPYGLSGNSDSSRLMVIITEFYPLQGRVWFNHYNYNKWAGWFSEYDRLTGYVNKMAEVKTAFGEMGAYENLEVRGSICCQFNVYNKCDIHISCKVISNTVEETNLFSFLSGEKIRTLLGLNSFSNNAYASKVIVQNYSGTKNLSEFAGLGGFRAYTGVSTGDIQLGRIYTEEGQIGAWGANSELFKAATIFEIDLFNCSYT